MINFKTSGYEEMELSTQILIKEALKRNITIDILDKRDNFIRLRKNKKIEFIKQATRTSADTYIAPLIMENKLVTKKILKEHDITIPRGNSFNNKSEAINAFNKFIKMDIVIKPNSTNFGKGISILKDIYSKDDYQKAINTAFKFDSTVIIEEYIQGKEYRFLIIDYKVIAVLHRIPANVIGDGIKSITELVDLKNKSPLRGEGYVTPLEKIKLGKIEKEFLEKQGKNFLYIPKRDEQIFLRKNSNISTGGDSIDYTDNVLNEYKKIAVKSAKAVGAKICGADIIIRDRMSMLKNDNYGVIELNFNPALHIHCFPYNGINRHPEKNILNLLGY